MSDHDPDFAVDPENLMNENSSLEIRKKQDTRNSAAVSTMENPDLEREEIIMLTSIISDRDFRSTQRQEQSMFLDPEDIKPFEPLKSVMAKRTTFYSSASFLITESSHKCDQTDPSTYKAFPGLYVIFEFLQVLRKSYKYNDVNVEYPPTCGNHYPKFGENTSV
ncbi:unnamed protein product [Acanthoscelides obtectus]|uniref:Uncharacterized protein n=1 Tax=Acanthoscelides obtectus TaxID=200917 RepID=A0A9P0KLS2_ACAOB|nr:unnamed protein product [Acanthoscelides obtectus]CAK1674926.1 hypothetical protein AOBTE_LOCUS29815 [Acanthoscelides obtectus]